MLLFGGCIMLSIIDDNLSLIFIFLYKKIIYTLKNLMNGPWNHLNMGVDGF
jgi:hypothetical protein